MSDKPKTLAERKARMSEQGLPAYLYECLTCGEKKEVETVAEAQQLCQMHSEKTTITAGHYTSYKPIRLKPGQVFRFGQTAPSPGNREQAAPLQPQVEELRELSEAATAENRIPGVYTGKANEAFKSACVEFVRKWLAPTEEAK